MHRKAGTSAALIFAFPPAYSARSGWHEPSAELQPGDSCSMPPTARLASNVMRETGMHSALRYGLPTVAFGFVAWLFFWPVPIDPIPVTFEPAPGYVGPFAPNSLLATADRLAKGAAVGPEDVDADAEGRIYGGFADGSIRRFAPDGSGGEVLANTGGRPLGMDFDEKGNLYIADGSRGLIVMHPDGTLEDLSNQADGVPFALADDVDVGADGKVYFSDASFKFPLDKYEQDILESRPNGRLLVFDPANQQTRTLAEGLYFANGVAVSPDASFVLVNETSRYRVKKVWLTGEKAGQSEVILDNLPGFPDGISSNGRGTYWMAIASPRQSAVDDLGPYPFLRKVVARLPKAVQPAPERYGMIAAIDGDGKVLHVMQDPSPTSYSPITSVEEKNGMLLLGSMSYDAIGRIAAPVTPDSAVPAPGAAMPETGAAAGAAAGAEPNPGAAPAAGADPGASPAANPGANPVTGTEPAPVAPTSAAAPR